MKLQEIRCPLCTVNIAVVFNNNFKKLPDIYCSSCANAILSVKHNVLKAEVSDSDFEKAYNSFADWKGQKELSETAATFHYYTCKLFEMFPP